MHPRFLRVTAAVVCATTLTTACENLSPSENAAIFGTVVGATTGIALAASGVNPNLAVPIAVGAGALVAGGAYIISKHQATVRQRKIAEQRARLYLAERAAAERAAARTASTSSSGSTAKKSSKPPKETRYIAVKTEKESFNKGETAVMIYDTQSNQIVGNNVYDLKGTPKVGQTSKFDTYVAEYVGGS